MRIVVDTNQVLKLPNFPELRRRSSSLRGIALAPFVIAEILLRSDPAPMVSRLQGYNIRYGLETSDLYDQLASLSECEIVQFEPFLRSGYLVSTDDLYLALKAPSEDQRTTAQRVKQQNLDFCSSMATAAINFRSILRSRGLWKEKRWWTVSQAVIELEGFHKDLVFDSISNGSQRQMSVVDKELLYSAVMRNPYLSRLFKALLYYILAWSRMWEDGVNNFDPSGSRDDWTDITLPLYANSGDVILTEDTKLIQAIRMVEEGGTVIAKRAIDL